MRAMLRPRRGAPVTLDWLVRTGALSYYR